MSESGHTAYVNQENAMDGQSQMHECCVTWEQEQRGRAESGGRAAIAIGPPPEFGGSGDVWSPEHLAAAAVNACVMLTFLTIAGNSKVSVAGYASSATVKLEKVEGRGMVITAVTLRPRITVPVGTDTGRVARVLRMAEKNCFISNSLTATLIVEPEIITAG